MALLATGLHRFARETPAAVTGRPQGGALGLFRMPKLRNMIVVGGTIASAMTVYPLIVSLHSVSVGIAPSWAGLLLGGFAIGALVPRLGIPVVTRFVPPRPILFLSVVSGGVLFALIPMFEHLTPLFALSGCLGLALGIGMPIALSLIYSSAPDGRANEAVGLDMSVTNFLQAATPLTLGFIADGMGVGPMGWALAATMIGVALATLRPKRRTL